MKKFCLVAILVGLVGSLFAFNKQVLNMKEKSILGLSVEQTWYLVEDENIEYQDSKVIVITDSKWYISKEDIENALSKSVHTKYPVMSYDLENDIVVLFDSKDIFKRKLGMTLAKILCSIDKN